MKEYIYKSLSDFGNSFIMAKDYKKLGEENILKDLQEHGFNCVIEKRICSNNQFGASETLKPRKQRGRKKQADIIYVITDKRRFEEDGKRN